MLEVSGFFFICILLGDSVVPRFSTGLQATTCHDCSGTVLVLLSIFAVFVNNCSTDYLIWPKYTIRCLWHPFPRSCCSVSLLSQVPQFAMKYYILYPLELLLHLKKNPLIILKIFIIEAPDKLFCQSVCIFRRSNEHCVHNFSWRYEDEVRLKSEFVKRFGL